MIKKIFFKFIIIHDYIKHHLSHFRINILNFKIVNDLNYKKYSFWILNLDSFIISFLLLIILIFLIKKTIDSIKYKKILSKKQIFLDIIIYFVYKNVIYIYGEKNKFVFSLSFSIFTWILVNNLLGLFPIDILPYLLNVFFSINNFSIVPTSDLNVTLSISIVSLFLIFLYKFRKFGFKYFIKNFFFHPFKNIFLIPINVFIETINLFSKILSLSLRLFGNIYSGEIIFMLVYFIIPMWIQWLIIIPLMILHSLISFLQSFIFMILILIYIS